LTIFAIKMKKKEVKGEKSDNLFVRKVKRYKFATENKKTIYVQQ